MSAPVGNTCPMNYRIINNWRDSIHFIESMIAEIEDVRNANADLREWGEKMESERDEFERRVEELKLED